MALVKVPDVARLVIDEEPKKVLVVGEPYLVLTARGYAPALDVVDSKTRQRRYIFVSAASIASELEKLRVVNGDRFDALEFWLWKESGEKNSKYRVRA